MRRTLLIAVALVPLCLRAQERLPKMKPTAQGMLNLPVQLANPMFDRLTYPLGEADLSFQLPVWKNFGVGVGAKMMWWELKDQAFTLTRTVGQSRRFTWYGKAQYAAYTSQFTFYELNAKLGSSRWTWDCETCPQVVKQDGLHYAFQAGYFIHASDNLAFGLTLGYERDLADLSPSVIGQEMFNGYTDRGGPYRFITIGLGFSTTFERTQEEKW